MPSHLLTDSDPRWDAERAAFNVLVDQRPAAIALPGSAAEAAAAVRAAAAAGRRVAAQRTGHAAITVGELDGAVLVRTAGLRGIEIDRERRLARVGAGELWGDVLASASAAGLAPLHGSAPDVSVAGYTLGGGVSFYGRKHGLACNRVTAIELVTAEGEQLRVDAETEPDLFWALRGGGGGFGLVTAFEFELVAMPEVYAGALFFPADGASEVLHAWRELTGAAPEELTTIGRLMNFPPLPELPEPLRGQSFALVEGIHCGEQAEADELLEPLRRLGPAMDTFAVGPPASIAELHMDPPEPAPYVAEGAMTSELPAAAIERLLEAVGPGSGSQLVSAEVRHCGGALARAADGAGALAQLPGEFLAFAVGMVMTPDAQEPTAGWVDAFTESLAPYDGGRYLNFCERRTGLEAAYPPDTVGRLLEVKRRYDPDDRFQACHPITG